VNDAGLVRAGESVGYLCGDREDSLDRKRSGEEQLPQVLSLDQLHGDPGDGI
jgi:hypothetical protein